MRAFIRILIALMLLIVGLPLLLVVAVFVALNTGAGRAFALKEINHFAGPQIAVAGLAGHFPADLKIARLSIADARGVWASGANLQLRWRPLALLHRDVHVTALTADALNVARAPLPGPPSKSKSSFHLPKFTLELDRLAVRQLAVGAALAGQPTVLALTGNARLRDLLHGEASLAATAANGRGTYRLSALLDPKLVGLDVDVAEPPDGLLGHFAGPKIHQPLSLTVSLRGPRDDAALRFAAALGAARLNGSGTLGLDPNAPKADVVLNVPALAPAAALAGQHIAGATSLHLVAGTAANHGTDLALDGQVALTAAPGPAAKLVGPDGALRLRANILHNAITIKTFEVNGAGFAVAASGTVAKAGFDLATHLQLNNVALLAPGMAGVVSEDGTVAGTMQDFAVNATVAGTVTRRGIPSGPFTFQIAAQNLPKTPRGTLLGGGMLENFPLHLDTAFARGATGAARLKINAASWRSLTAKADLMLAAGAKLPTGSATFAITQLADFRAFSPVPVSGSVNGNFAHANAANFALNLNARNLLASPSLGAINGTITANGPLAALGVRVAAKIARVMSAPANLAAAGTVNIPRQSLSLANLTAAWHGLNARLVGAAAIETKPAIAVHHLVFGLSGGTIRLDGTISPHLALHFAVDHLPARLAGLVAPKFAATGTVSAAGTIAGAPRAPTGNFTLAATAIHLQNGPPASLPPADLVAAIKLAGKTATLRMTLNAGQDVFLSLQGLAPLSRTGPVDLHLAARLPAGLARLAGPTFAASGTLAATADIAGTAAAPSGRVTVDARAIRLQSGPAAALPPANLTAAANLRRQTADLQINLNAGPNIAVALNGLAPLTKTGPVALHLTGRLDLRLLDPILAAQGTLVHGVITPDLTVTGTAVAPDAAGTVVLANGTVSNIGTGLSLTNIAANVSAAGKIVTLRDLTATAGQGTITGHGTVDLGAPTMPITLALDADDATPISSDLLTENLDAALTLAGALRGRLALGGEVSILKANINIPKTLPPSVANLPIVNRGAAPLPPAPPPPAVALKLHLVAANQIFIRGDGLFAELGGDMRIGGTAAAPDPEGGFTLIRGYFSLGGKTLQFTSGTVSFNGGGFIPSLDLEASVTDAGTTASLVIGGTAAKPTITLTSTPPLPSDEVLSQLLFGKGTAGLTPFQAASLAAALAQLAGVGGGASPLDSVRNALGLDELSLGGSGSAPTLQAGRYVAPGVYVGAQQGATGGGTQATVQINLYKGLKLTTTTGASTSGSGGQSSSVGLTYQFNY